MKEFIHCNKCSAQFSRSNVKFFVTSCTHVVCERCLHHGVEGKCPVCSCSTEIAALANDMDSKIMEYFMPLEEKMVQLDQVIAFQTDQIGNFFKFFMRKYNETKKQAIKYYTLNKAYEGENAKIKSLIMKMQASYEPKHNNDPKIFTSTPVTATSSAASPYPLNATFSPAINNFRKAMLPQGMSPCLSSNATMSLPKSGRKMTPFPNLRNVFR